MRAYTPEAEDLTQRFPEKRARRTALAAILAAALVAAACLLASCGGTGASSGAASAPESQEAGMWCLVSTTWFDGDGNQTRAKNITLDEHGNKLTERDDMGRYIRTRSYTFDENGFTTRVSWSTERVEGGASATASTAVSSVENTFNTEGLLERSTTTTAYETGAANREEATFTYYDDGRLHAGRSEQVSDYTLTTTYEYDTRGYPLLASETASTSVGTAGLIEAEWEFDGSGNPVGLTVTGEQTGRGRYDVICDEHGNIVEIRDESGVTKATFAYKYVEAPSPCVLQQNVQLQYYYLTFFQ